ncbi:MAG: cobalamin B12-binding domain-containing protein [Actinobacteria bacterium]|nr:MAG: cobalamin B12-binding domain-containing protein [Actinomycetota bacterium]
MSLMNPSDGPSELRIGELSRRVGVSGHVLRAWEARYGLLSPVRTPGGFRLYSDGDEQRVRRMQVHLAEGLSAAEAARAAIAESQAQPSSEVVQDDTSEPVNASDLRALSHAWQRALDDFDEPSAQAVLDRLLSSFSLATTLRDVVLPYLHRLGDRWERGEVTIAQEHFASNVIRGRLAGLARGWGSGHGPRAILACPPGELHDLSLLIFGIVLNRNGWRIEYLGADTPVQELVGAVGRARPDLVVVAATTSVHFRRIRPDLARLAGVVPLALAGTGATREVGEGVGARVLIGDPITAAENEASENPSPGA